MLDTGCLELHKYKVLNICCVCNLINQHYIQIIKLLKLLIILRVFIWRKSSNFATQYIKVHTELQYMYVLKLYLQHLTFLIDICLCTVPSAALESNLVLLTWHSCTDYVICSWLLSKYLVDIFWPTNENIKIQWWEHQLKHENILIQMMYTLTIYVYSSRFPNIYFLHLSTPTPPPPHFFLNENIHEVDSKEMENIHSIN